MDLENVIDIEVELEEIDTLNINTEEIDNIDIDMKIAGPKGDPGPQGPPGKDGYTPIKGEDYFTEDDIRSLNIPTKTSQLENNNGFITKDVTGLYNYYDETEIDNMFVNALEQIYLKEDIDNMIGDIETLLGGI